MNVSIAYFSGTGCTALCAQELGRAIGRIPSANNRVRMLKIAIQKERIGYEECGGSFAPAFEFPACDTLALMFPVHAFDAPAAVHDFLSNLQANAAKRAVVVSVSGGGEMLPNRASRSKAIETLEAKGIPVLHEEMLCMPCNVIAPTPPRAARALIAVLPAKCDALAKRLEEDEGRRVEPPTLDGKIASAGFLSNNAKAKARFAQNISVSDACISCGSCATACPCDNISMHNGQPSFGSKCAICLGCIYACPQSALSPRIGSFLILKEGFSLADMQNKNTFGNETEIPHERESKPAAQISRANERARDIPTGIQPALLDDLRGPLWKGVRDYLSES